jgi:hypothetical protein
MTILLRLFAWGLAAAVAYATLGPAEQRPHSNLGQNGEHALAFVPARAGFGLAYARAPLRTAASSCLYGLIEVLQFWAPAGTHGCKTLWWMRWRPAQDWPAPWRSTG